MSAQGQQATPIQLLYAQVQSLAQNLAVQNALLLRIAEGIDDLVETITGIPAAAPVAAGAQGAPQTAPPGAPAPGAQGMPAFIEQAMFAELRKRGIDPAGGLDLGQVLANLTPPAPANGPGTPPPKPGG